MDKVFKNLVIWFLVILAVAAFFWSRGLKHVVDHAAYSSERLVEISEEAIEDVSSDIVPEATATEKLIEGEASPTGEVAPYVEPNDNVWGYLEETSTWINMFLPLVPWVMLVIWLFCGGWKIIFHPLAILGSAVLAYLFIWVLYDLNGTQYFWYEAKGLFLPLIMQFDPRNSMYWCYRLCGNFYRYVQLPLTLYGVCYIFEILKIRFTMWFDNNDRIRPGSAFYDDIIIPIADDVKERKVRKHMRIPNIRKVHYYAPHGSEDTKTINAYAWLSNNVTVYPAVVLNYYNEGKTEMVRGIIGHELGHLNNGDTMAIALVEAFMAPISFVTMVLVSIFTFIGLFNDNYSLVYSNGDVEDYVGIIRFVWYCLAVIVIPIKLIHKLLVALEDLLHIVAGKMEERGADIFATKLGYGAGLLEFFEFLENECNESHDVFDPHPATSKRIKYVKAQMEKMDYADQKKQAKLLEKQNRHGQTVATKDQQKATSEEV